MLSSNSSVFDSTSLRYESLFANDSMSLGDDFVPDSA